MIPCSYLPQAEHSILPGSGKPSGELSFGAGAGGIDILAQMAAAGEIDPKDIDIVEVTDKFLKAIAAAPRENLRQSGKILFHASVLLRLKAEALLDATGGGGDDFLEFDADGGPVIYDSQMQAVGRQITLEVLERALIRRANIRQLRARKVTLEQLIEALRQAERIERTRLQNHRQPRIDLVGQPNVNDVDDILELAHQEDIETFLEQVEEILMASLDAREMLTFLELTKQLRAQGDWVDVFLSLLFLANAGKITLEQEEFYGSLCVKRPEACPASWRPGQLGEGNMVLESSPL